jgi:hypothetical protein
MYLNFRALGGALFPHYGVWPLVSTSQERNETTRLRRELEQAVRDRQNGSGEQDARVNEEAESLQQVMLEREGRLKADMKVLAKEVKKLRKENAMLAAKVAQASLSLTATEVEQTSCESG